MIRIAPQNTGKMNVADLFDGAGKGNMQRLHADTSVQGAKLLPFAVIFTKLVNKASQGQDAVLTAIDPKATQMKDMAAGWGLNMKQHMPLGMLKMKDGFSGQEEDVIAVGVDLQALFQALQAGESTGKNTADPTRTEEAAAALSAYLSAIISALQNQAGAEASTQTAVEGDGGQGEVFAKVRLGAEKGKEVINQLLYHGANGSSGGKDQDQQLLLTLPQELLKDFVINKNGRPHFPMNGMEDTTVVLLPAEGVDATVPGQPFAMTNTVVSLDKEGLTFQLVRLNTQASAASPQGALAVAASTLQKKDQVTPATPAADAASPDGDGDLTVNPFRHEILVKNTGEREARNIPSTGAPVADGESSGKGIPQSVASVEQDPMTAAKSTGTVDDMVLQGEEKAKNAPIVSGKESTHWVPFAGATSPQLAPESGTAPKGVFIPMDRVISEAGKILENGAGKVQMTLQPPNLGTINMEVFVRNNRVDLVLTANHADVQQILQANADQLKNALSNQGFQIDQMSVLLKRDNLGFNLGGHSLRQDGAGQQPGHGNGSTGSNNMSTPEVEKLVPRRDYGTGMISIFV